MVAHRTTTVCIIVGGVVSPLLANLFLHYAFDRWMARVYPDLRFERYADDALVHCRSEAEARTVLGGHPGSPGEMRSGASSHEDPDRLLQGRRPAGDARTHRVRLPRLHLPTATGEEPVGAILHQLPAGDQHQGRDGDPADRPRLADGVHQEQPAPGGSGSPCEPGSAGLAELLRAVLSLAVRSGAPLLQRGPREMGAAEVHAVPTPGACGHALAGAHRPPRSRPVRPVAAGRAAGGWSVGAG